MSVAAHTGLRKAVENIIRSGDRMRGGTYPYMIPNPQGDEVIYGISDFDFVALDPYTCCSISVTEQLLLVAKTVSREVSIETTSFLRDVNESVPSNGRRDGNA